MQPLLDKYIWYNGIDNDWGAFKGYEILIQISGVDVSTTY